MLVNGAAGSIAVQLVKARRAHVTGVDHGDRMKTVRALGADAVVDYRRENFTLGEARFDLVSDVSILALARCTPVLTPEGLYILIDHDHYRKGACRLFGSIPRIAAGRPELTEAKRCLNEICITDRSIEAGAAVIGNVSTGGRGSC